MLAQVEEDKVLCFDCYSVKDYLKKLRFRWDPNRRVWHKEGVTQQELRYLQSLGFEVLYKTKKKVNEDIYNEMRELYPYAFEHQLISASIAAQERAFLIGDEPGAGKTLQAIMFVDYLLYKGYIERAIVFCPSSIKRQWRDEVYRFIKEAPYILEGSPSHRRRIYRLFSMGKEYPLLIANYELIIRDDLFEFLKELEPNAFALVLDEASRVKNKQSKTFKRLREIAKRTNFKIALTGTPIENSLQEFWAIAHILKGKEFMSFAEFERQHVNYYTLNLPHLHYPIKKVRGYKNIAQFIARVEPFYIRRKKEDVRKDMPPLVEYTREIELTPLQREIENYLLEGAKEEKGVALEGVIQLLRVIGDDPRLLRKSESETGRKVYLKFKDRIDKVKENRKIEELEEILKEHEGKAIVFTSFSKMAQVLAKSMDALLITGQTPERERARIIGEFKSKNDRKVLVATDALTYGASLDEADTVVHFDIPWSVGKLVQRTDRIHRITSQRNKMVYYLVSGGVERKVWELLQSKVKLFKDVVEGEALGDMKKEIIALLKK